MHGADPHPQDGEERLAGQPSRGSACTRMVVVLGVTRAKGGRRVRRSAGLGAGLANGQFRLVFPAPRRVRACALALGAAA
jgi:hypothetical protein